METGSEGESDRDNNSQSDGSKKRKRQMKTPFQLEMLEKTYALEMHPSAPTIAKLSETLGLTDHRLRIWFTKRRFKDKKEGTVKRAVRDGEVGEQMEYFNTNKKHGVLKFQVGQLAETKTFQTGFRSAWFRCKIRDVNLEKNKILPDYYDFEGEEIKWVKIYEKPPYGTKTNKNKKRLMVRPQYPVIYHKSEMPAVSSISEVCVIIDGEWKVGDLVDWHEDDSYWSASIIKILTNDKVQIELPKCPEGQGKIYKAFCKDLRPSLDWSPRKGWTLPTMKGRTSCSARLLFPSPQDENASSTSRISVISLAAPIEESPQSHLVKIDGDFVEKATSLDSISTTQVDESEKENVDASEKEDANYNIIDLNIMHEETLEASVLDLEELANRIKWLRRILESNHSKSGSWKFGEQHFSIPST